MQGVELGGYRSFGNEPQRFGPLAKVNLIVGQNNSGKSNILRFVHGHLARVLEFARSQQTGELGFHALDVPRPKGAAFQFGYALNLREGPSRERLAKFLERSQGSDMLEELVDVLSVRGNLAWFRFVSSSVTSNQIGFSAEWLKQLGGAETGSLWARLNLALHSIRGDSTERSLANVLGAITRVVLLAPDVVLVPAIRKVGSGDLTHGDFSGSDIIGRLADLQHPQFHELEKKRRFRSITAFVATVLDAPEAEIEIPVTKDTVHVYLGGQPLPLESLGTGIHEVTMLAAWATVHENQVLCIEEPEIHLHPVLQKRLIHYLATQTGNQYLITTHSAHILDEPGARIFHTRWDQVQTSIKAAGTSMDRLHICTDLGYRAADILQANAIVWVEGPSDRIYLRHWIAALAPELMEGSHYSLMHYGGRLLARLSAADPEIDDFVALRKINQQLSIVIDSDRSSPSQRLGETKSRVRREFDDGPGFAWVTKGREVENYVKSEIMLSAHRLLHGDKVISCSDGRFDHAFEYRTAAGVKTSDKIKLAYAVANHPPDLNHLDLRPQIVRLVEFIRRANALSGVRPPELSSRSKTAMPVQRLV